MISITGQLWVESDIRLHEPAARSSKLFGVDAPLEQTQATCTVLSGTHNDYSKVYRNASTAEHLTVAAGVLAGSLNKLVISGEAPNELVQVGVSVLSGALNTLVRVITVSPDAAQVNVGIVYGSLNKLMLYHEGLPDTVTTTVQLLSGSLNDPNI